MDRNNKLIEQETSTSLLFSFAYSSQKQNDFHQCGIHSLEMAIPLPYRSQKHAMKQTDWYWATFHPAG